jgi:hypothetical protein
MDKPENVSITTPTGTEKQEITRDMIIGDYGLLPANPNFELPLSKEVKRQDLVYLLDVFSKNPTALQQVNVPAYMKKLFELYDIKDYEELIVSQQPVPNEPVETLVNEIPPEVEQPEQMPEQEIPQDVGVEQNGYS